MTVNSTGSKGQPIVSDPPTSIADFAAHSTYAALVGNRIAGPATNRTNFAAVYGFAPFSGLEYFETDTLNTFVYTDTIDLSTGWVGTKSESGLFAFGTGNFSAAGGGYQASVQIFLDPTRFTAIPIVTTGVFTTASQKQHAGVSAVSATGFTLYYWRENLSATTVGWTASPSQL